MPEITHCSHCGQKLTPTIGSSGRTELTCLHCDDIDPMCSRVTEPADSQLASPAATSKAA